jgi:hypothetical protein
MYQMFRNKQDACVKVVLKPWGSAPMNLTANLSRNEGDPQILASGASSLSVADQVGRALGWFSFALGFAEVIAPGRLTRVLGMGRQEALLRVYGAREIAAGIMALSSDRRTALWSRVAGDGLDLATLLAARRADNPKRGNVGVAIGLVLGVAALDVAAALALSRERRRNGESRSYNDRSGFPQAVARASGNILQEQ